MRKEVTQKFFLNVVATLKTNNTSIVPDRFNMILTTYLPVNGYNVKQKGSCSKEGCVYTFIQTLIVVFRANFCVVTDARKDQSKLYWSYLEEDLGVDTKRYIYISLYLHLNLLSDSSNTICFDHF